MRGALEPLSGVAAVDAEPGRTRVWVTLDPERVQPVQLLAALEKAKEKATLAPAGE